MPRDKNTIALYVDKDLVNIYKAGLVMYEALKEILVKYGVDTPTTRKARQALALAEERS